MGKEYSLISDDEIERLDRYFKREGQEAYIEALNNSLIRVDASGNVVPLSDDEGVDKFREWTDDDHPEFIGLFNAYNAEVRIFLNGLVKLNKFDLSQDAQPAAEGRSFSYTQTLGQKYEADIAPITPVEGEKVVFRKWSNYEENWIEKRLNLLDEENITKKELWKRFQMWRFINISEEDVALIKAGEEIKIGRTYSAFLSKVRKIEKRLEEEAKEAEELERRRRGEG